MANDTQINTEELKKNLILTNITGEDIDNVIVNFNNGKLGIIDGSLSQACTQALNTLIPKNVSTVPVAAMESHTLRFGKYKSLHSYACEQKQANDEVLGLLYVYSESDKSSFDDTVKLNEAVGLMSDEQKAASVVYCPKSAHQYNIEDSQQWAQENGVAYTNDLQSAVEHWSGKRAIKAKR